MNDIIQRVRKVGGSLMVRIPKDAAEFARIEEGDYVQFVPKKLRKDWFGCAKGIGPWMKEDLWGKE